MTHGRLRYLAALSALLGGGCGGEVLEAFPSRVVVASPVGDLSVVVAVTARLRSASGAVSDAPISWRLLDPSFGGRVSLATSTGRDNAVSIVTLGGGVFRIEASSRGQADVITFDLDQTSTSGPHAKATHHDGQFPAVAMMAGLAGTCPADSTIAFVTDVPLAAWSGCTVAEAMVLTAGRELQHWAPWQTTNDLDASEETGVGPNPRVVPLKLWTAGGVTALAISAATLQIDQANGLLERNRAGIRIALDPTVGTVSSVAGCSELQDLILATPPVDLPNVYAVGAVNLYLKSGIVSGDRAEWCLNRANTNWRGGVALAGDIGPGSLVHELGHGFGLVEPWGGGSALYSGHVDRVAGFGEDNIMWGLLTSSEGVTRTQFSPGQIYRMNRDLRSWLVRPDPSKPTPNEVDCKCNPYGTACPRLSRDARPIADKGANLKPGVCP